MPRRNGPHVRAPGETAERDRLPRAIAARLARTGWVTAAHGQAAPARDDAPPLSADAADAEEPGREGPGR